MARIILNMAISILIIIGISFPAFAVTYKYDALNRLVEVEYETGQKITYTYDAGGNILNVEVYTPLQLDPIRDREVDEGQLLEFTLQATGAAGDTIVYSADNLPPGAAFDPASATFSWTPAYSQAGVYPGVRFEARAGSAVAGEEITITVHDVNTPPGENVVVVDEAGGIAFTFEQVEVPGNTAVTLHESLPEGSFHNVSFLPVYYDITTTAQFSGQVRIKVNYDPSGLELYEKDIRLYHIKDGQAVDITDPLNPGPGGNPDTAAHTVEGVTADFSCFALGLDTRLKFTAGDDPVQLFTPPGVEATWSTSDEAVACVSETGLVTPVSIGAATITLATADGLHVASFEVVVVPGLHWLQPTDKRTSPLVINPNQTLRVKFYLTDGQDNRLHLDNIAVEVRSAAGETLGSHTLDKKGQWQLKRNPQGIYHANVNGKTLNLQPGGTYHIAVTMDNHVIDYFAVTVKDGLLGTLIITIKTWLGIG